MHGADTRLTHLRATAEGLSPHAQRDLVAYWGRRKFEGRPSDWT